MNAIEASKLTRESAPAVEVRRLKAEADRLAQELEEARRKKAEEDAKFNDQYACVQKKITYHAQNGEYECTVDTQYIDDKERILKALLVDEFTAKIGTRYHTDSRPTADGGQGDPYTVRQACYEISWPKLNCATCEDTGYVNMTFADMQCTDCEQWKK